MAEHYDRLLRMARLICRDTGDAADAVQTGLERAWRRRSTLRDDARIRPWLDRIVTREAVRISKSRQSWLIYPVVEVDDGTDLHGETDAWLSGR